MTQVIKSKIFIGLCAFGFFATIAAKFVLEMLLIKLGKGF